MGSPDGNRKMLSRVRACSRNRNHSFMRSIVLAVVVSLLGSSLHSQAIPAMTDSASTWTRALSGPWTCAGAFANGKALAADIVFTPALGGRWLSYHHQDRDPGRYEATALLGPALRDSAMVATMIFDNFGGHRRFLPSASATGEITLVRDTTESGSRLERFTFRPRPDGTLWFGWEVGRGGAWVLGDSLSCNKGDR